MKYIKAVFFSFLIIFFANLVLPGVEIINRTKLPHLGSDFPFALLLGFLNASIYPVVKLFGKKSPIFQIVTSAIILNFAFYGTLSLLSIGIHLETIHGFLLVSSVVVVASIIANLIEMMGDRAPPEEDPVTLTQPIERIDPSEDEDL